MAAAGATGHPQGLIGLSATLPAASWLPEATLDELTPQSLRRLANRRKLIMFQGGRQEPAEMALRPRCHP